jgi:Cdc6-like AAA superfamily ATPase
LDAATQQLYDEIISNWSVEAKKENRAYFYNIQEVNVIVEGRKTIVIGRKGSGKTAIAQHLFEMDKEDVFAEKLSFKNFPFNILYSLENQKEYTSPNQYISIWKYLIYSHICKKMITNKNINSNVRNKLTKLYGDSSIKSLNRLIEKWTSKSFGAEILGVGFNYEREKQGPELTWIDAIDILEQVILDYCDTAKYLIIFDELDEDYKDFQSEAESTNYMCMLTSLFKAVQDIRNIFSAKEKQIIPVVFLRSDIYTRLKDSDKNKWSESIIYLEWDSNQIQRMLAHRLCVAFGIPDTDFNTIWYKLFDRRMVKMGNRQTREMDIFTYIERSTEMRPRDFIKYVKECVTIAKERSEIPISPPTVKDADDNFSEYLKGETIDEIFAVIPEVNEILGLLSTIRKQSFKFDTFEIEYNKLVERGMIPKRDVKKILLILFDAGVIGNQPSMRGKAIFRFSTKSPRFNFNETMMVHRGLYKALQIF